jgi:RNA polymerase sigma-70 factor, ECF subfamily
VQLSCRGCDLAEFGPVAVIHQPAGYVDQLASCSVQDDHGIPDLEGASDAELVGIIRRWRKEALGEVYRRHAGAVFALAQRVLGNRSLAEEVVQEVFLRLWNQPERFDPNRGSLRSYLLAQSHGRSIDLFRSEMSRGRRERADAARRVDHEPDIATKVQDLAVSVEVHRALEVLPDTEASAIRLAYFGGRSYREVASLLNVPEGTVKSRIRAGLHRLRAALNEAGVREV